MCRLIFFFLTSLMAIAAHAQQKPAPPAPPATADTTVVVLGSPIPITEQESARSVVSLDTQEVPMGSHQIEDYLRTDASVDIQQRAGGGIMADISVRGSSFEQVLVLLNGFRMDDAETSHFNLDLPVPLMSVGRIDVLHGTGSTLYGSDALGGVVDVRTVSPADTGLRVKAEAGSFGETGQGVAGSIVKKSWSDVVAGDHELSTGFMTGRDYRTESASNEVRFASPLGHSDVLLAGDDRAFGANQFYGPYDSWERTKGWFGGVTQAIDAHTQVAAAYRRHSDIFLLERDEPAGYKNQHIDSGFEGAIRDERSVAENLTLASGLAEDTDQIVSTNLGQHGRNRGAGYAVLEWMRGGRGSLSAGAREEVFDGGRSVFSPMVSATRWLSKTTTLHASIGHGFRIPTFLDLYYSDPSTLGNPELKPESAWNFEGGASWYPRPQVTATVTAFYSRQHDTIDYTRASETDLWQASNLTGVRFTGVEAAMTWQPRATERLALSWTNLIGAQSALHGLESKYVFNYPVNNARVDWTQQIGREVAVVSRLGIVQRFEKSAYGVWDVSLTRQRGRFRPYLQMTNLTNTGYEEIIDVRMPPRGFVGGCEIVLTRARGSL